MMELKIKEIKRDMAKTFVEIYHYSHNLGVFKRAYGLYQKKNLVGCCVFGFPVGRQTIKSISPILENEEVLELTRLVIIDEIGKNAESYFISRAIKNLKEDIPTIKVIISYADPMHTHKGTIYQASNFLYQGNKTMLIQGYWHFLDGKKIHPRSLVAKYGTIKEDELKKLGLNYKRIKMLNKHRYILLVGSKKEKKEIMKTLKHPILPYPKKAGEVSREIRLISNRERMVQFHHPALQQKTLSNLSATPRTLPNGNSDKSEEFNMGLKVPTSSPPKLSPTEITSPNPNIKCNNLVCLK